MTSHRVAPSWTTSLRRSWVRWYRTRWLRLRVRRLQRQVRRQEKVLALQLEHQRLLLLLEEPLRLLPQELPPVSTEPFPEELDPPPPLTPEEIEELRALPMPDPLEEIRHRLVSTSTP